jgi:Flp pilus assembly pilin Flp
MTRGSAIILRSARRAAERGATSVEYAFVVSLIAVIVIAGAVLVGSSTTNNFDQVGSLLP